MTMTTLRFYGELNDYIPEINRQLSFRVFCNTDTSISNLMESLRVPASKITLVLANGKPVDMTYTVKEDDRISIYPRFRNINLDSLH